MNTISSNYACWQKAFAPFKARWYSCCLAFRLCWHQAFASIICMSLSRAQLNGQSEGRAVWFHSWFLYHSPLQPERDWEIDLDHVESLMDDTVSAIVVNNPSNPCGSVYSRQHLLDLLSVCEKHHCPIVSDDIYQDMVSMLELVWCLQLAVDMSVPVSSKQLPTVNGFSLFSKCQQLCHVMDEAQMLE